MTTAELGAFLRSRRERISPPRWASPPGGRRRTPGLRREELALLSGVSTSWYTFLEQGRDVQPSAQVLDALAGALSLTGDERDHLMRLGGLAPAPPSPDPEPVDPGSRTSSTRSASVPPTSRRRASTSSRSTTRPASCSSG